VARESNLSQIQIRVQIQAQVTMDVNEETEFSNVGEHAYDGPRAYNYEPPRRDRSQGEIGGGTMGRGEK